MLDELERELEGKQNAEQGKLLQKYFKTGKGEYGEGDIFIGIKVPVLREISEKYKELGLEDIEKLLESKIHEFRLVALFILVHKYKTGNKKEIFDFYIHHTKNINNWDLVDLSAHSIVGDFLLNKDKDILYKLIASNNIWEKRIAIISTFAFIKNGKFDDSLKMAKILLKEKHDLIHKAVGWMLREIGKRNRKTVEDFLRENYKNMPRTMLRYAIEKFPESLRQDYLKGRI